MLYRGIMAVCSEIHAKQINTLCGQNVELLNVTPGGTYSDQWATEGWITLQCFSNTAYQKHQSEHRVFLPQSAAGDWMWHKISNDKLSCW